MNARKIKKIGIFIVVVLCIGLGTTTISAITMNSSDNSLMESVCINLLQNTVNSKIRSYESGKSDKIFSLLITNQMPILKYGIVNYENFQQENNQGILTKENVWLENQIAKENTTKIETGNVEYIPGEVYIEDAPLETKEEKVVEESKLVEKLVKNKSTDYLLKNFYIIDSTTRVDKTLFDVEKMLSKDFSMKKKDTPQILIFHTHGASEGFSDSREGNKNDSIVGVGAYLAKILKEEYGYQVIHDKTEYDNIQGKIDRSRAYNYALPAITKTLENNSSIEVVIDLHRDGVSNKEKRVTKINGKQTAKFMFFNGISRNTIGSIAYLYNANLEANLSFSLQLKIKAMEKYPDLTMLNYLKGYRYNLHLKEKSLLIELGNQNNTVQEAKNAMQPLAEIIHDVLQEK